MPLPNILSGEDTFRTWFDATNNLISHVSNTSAYPLLSNSTVTYTSNGDLNLDGTLRVRNLIANGEVTFNGSFVNVAANLNITQDVSLTKNLVLSGASAHLSVGASLTVSGFINALSTLRVTSTANVLGSFWVSGASTLNGLTTFKGNALFDTGTIASFNRVVEVITTSATTATGIINVDMLTQGVLLYTLNAGANWTFNFRGNNVTTLNDALGVNRSITIAIMVPQGSTPYYPTGHQIDGSAVTPLWQGVVPTTGSASARDIYTYTIIKTSGSPTYTVLAAQTRFV